MILDINKYFFIILLFIFGCNSQLESLQYNDNIISENIKGYSRDLHIQGDTLYVVNEDVGLLIYSLSIDSQMIALNSIYSNSSEYENWNLSGLLFSNRLKERLFLLDKFYCTYFEDLSDILDDNPIFQPLQCVADNHHSSKFTLNDSGLSAVIFTLVRKKSDYSTSDVSSIYQNKWFEGFNLDFPVIDSLNYGLTDVHYMNQKIIISNTNNIRPEFQIYNINSIDEPVADSVTLINTVLTPAIPNALFSTGDTLFVGMADHGGVQVYNIDNTSMVEEEINWFAKGFSIKEIFWDASVRLILMSCGFQGVVVIKLDSNMKEVDSWILNTSYAYASRYYNDYIIIATRNGLEIIRINL